MKIGEQQNELVATKASNGVDASRDLGQPSSDLGQHVVTRVVAESVVDVLEVVEIDEQQPDSPRAALECHERLLQPVHQCNPVRQSGNRVVERLMHEGMFGFDLGGHVAGYPPGADDLPLLVTQR